MNATEMIAETRQWVKDQLLQEKTGHDWYHIRRVTDQAIEIARIEGADELIVTLAALTHDLIDDKVVESEAEGLKNVLDWLIKIGTTEEQRQHIVAIITTMSYKGGTNQPVTTLEAQVVQDADRLDALGAIGVARTFVYAGSKGDPMYDPTLSVRETLTLDEYRNGQSSAIGHFYEKLLKLKDLMNTEEGKKRAHERHQFLKNFLDQFLLEWGQDSK
ncbi:HD domain-containing protein [Alkalihalobacillus sp. MEB130]|uniref:HD domain-containing protein n=1 Tax=Alkalihalobacillus sp. MEB130 TaxID=2976704 RepID=UPI0028DFE798|nr:HD domain-containing protein [Alkalihalobacillus sp. MEB130]MDT8862757.1 HD domain-containing protein [Alkalihalobacillus sp. MEB130]